MIHCLLCISLSMMMTASTSTEVSKPISAVFDSEEVFSLLISKASLRAALADSLGPAITTTQESLVIYPSSIRLGEDGRLIFLMHRCFDAGLIFYLDYSAIWLPDLAGNAPFDPDRALPPGVSDKVSPVGYPLSGSE